MRETRQLSLSGPARRDLSTEILAAAAISHSTLPHSRPRSHQNTLPPFTLVDEAERVEIRRREEGERPGQIRNPRFARDAQEGERSSEFSRARARAGDEKRTEISNSILSFGPVPPPPPPLPVLELEAFSPDEGAVINAICRQHENVTEFSKCPVSKSRCRGELLLPDVSTGLFCCSILRRRDTEICRYVTLRFLPEGTARFTRTCTINRDGNGARQERKMPGKIRGKLPSFPADNAQCTLPLRHIRSRKFINSKLIKSAREGSQT